MNAAESIKKARAGLLLRQGDASFWGPLALRLDLEERHDIPTCATDGRRLYFNPEFVDQQSPGKLQGVVAHETAHCILNHPQRLGDRDPAIANQAMDYAINAMLVADGFELIDGALFDPQYAGQSFEEVYRALMAQQPDDDPDDDPGDDAGDDAGDGEGGDQDGDDQQPGGSNDDQDSASGDDSADGNDATDDTGSDQDGDSGDQGDSDGQPGDGAGNGGNDAPQFGADPGGMGAVIPAPDDADESPEDIARDWQAAAVQAAAMSQGKAPGIIAEHIATFTQPQQDWQTIVRTYFDQFAADDYSMSRPNRAYIPHDLYMPSLVSDGAGDVVLMADTSGSVQRDKLAEFYGILRDVLATVPYQRLFVVSFHTSVYDVQELGPGDEFDDTRLESGGTTISSAFDWLADEGITPTLSIVFTDLCDYDLDRIEPPGSPVLWADWHTDDADRAPFGDYVSLAA